MSNQAWFLVEQMEEILVVLLAIESKGNYGLDIAQAEVMVKIQALKQAKHRGSKTAVILVSTQAWFLD